MAKQKVFDTGKDLIKEMDDKILKNQEVRVSKIVIKLGEHEEILTIDQARKLLDALKDLLGEDKERIVTVPYPYPYPSPIYIQPYQTPQYPNWRINYGINTTTNGTNSTLPVTATYSLS
jgi:hypothetical protein